MFYSTGLNREENTSGFTGFKGTTDSIIFAKRNIRTFENSIYLSYTLNNKSGIDLQARHYCSSFRNKDFYLLNTEGSLDAYSYNSPDGTFNMLNLDLLFRWIFAPGSELTLAWKKTVSDNRDQAEQNYFANLNNIFKADQSDSFSLKVLYYLDYNNLRRK
jgi:hypothetical protein